MGYTLARALGGEMLSRHIVIALWATPKSMVGTWVVPPSGGALDPPYHQSSGAQNDSITYDFASEAGTFTLNVFHFVGSNRGIYTVAIDGTTEGTFDGYNATADTAVGTISGVVLTAGQHTITFTMATKNGAASNYYATMNEAVLTQAA